MKDQEDYEGPRKEFLSSLSIRVKINEAVEDDLERAEELTIRTNQLNATGRTYGYKELKHYMTSDSHKLLVCEMDDKYGSYGKIGLALVEILEHHYHVRLLLMSCRVISMGIGTVLLTYIMQEARKAGKKLRADFRHTGRNRMMFAAFKFSNFKPIENDGSETVVMQNDLERIQEIPPYINVSFK